MATQLKSRPFAPFLFQKRIPLYLKALKFLLTLSFIGGFPSAAEAQTSSQQYVYGSQPNSPTSVVSGFTNAAPSSDTNRDPSGATATPTGRPSTSGPPGSGTSPVRNGTGSAEGLPSLNATNATWYPERAARFHEPCSATNAPPQ